MAAGHGAIIIHTWRHHVDIPTGYSERHDDIFEVLPLTLPIEFYEYGDVFG
jgi:hypothetical protein